MMYLVGAAAIVVATLMAYIWPQQALFVVALVLFVVMALADSGAVIADRRRVWRSVRSFGQQYERRMNRAYFRTERKVINMIKR